MLAAFAVAVAALASFVVLQVRRAHPMLPLSLFRSRTVSVAVATGFAFMAGYYGLPFVMSLYLQELRGVFNTSRQVGGTLAVAVFGVLLASKATFLPGMRDSLLIAAVIALGAAAVSLLIKPARRFSSAID